MAFVAFPSFLPQTQLEQAVSLPPGEECAEGHSSNTFPNHISPPTLTAHRRKIFDKSPVNALPREQGSLTESHFPLTAEVHHFWLLSAPQIHPLLGNSSRFYFKIVSFSWSKELPKKS
ncbi:hypothetical protein TNIN_498361 [Trichonephila inaurata madagascariensis]|uniref:Uncharacterized protein n=1 Tax=Trichonephila inaurata madagascariensis TaxID=2747483 RepID=A0A8X6YNA3_9ARAC|nr:hypothetical protein TNIN_498361 [Trichonephila inaurata madagascariensis]